MDDDGQADVEMTSSANDLPISALSTENQSDDLLLDSSGENTPTKMEGVDSITDLVTNVSLQEKDDKTQTPAKKPGHVSTTFHTPLPPREKVSRTRRSHSLCSFVSANSSPEQSVAHIPKSQRTMESYFVKSNKPVNKPNNDSSGANVVHDNTSTPKKSTKKGKAPNIVAEILAEKNIDNPDVGSVISESGVRGSKRKRNTSKPTDNYQVTSLIDENHNDDMPETIEDIIQPTTSDILLAESGRPTQTAVTIVSDNRGTTVNSLSVSFQVPPEGSRDPNGQNKDAPQDGKQPPEYPPVYLSWMEPLQVEYFLTTRSSVVSESRAKLRGMLLSQCTDNDLINPWALHLAPMPVYLYPHADMIVPFLKNQALELQRFCSDTLLDFSRFQGKKIEVDKECLKKVLGNNTESYKRVAGALFDARRRVRSEVENQLIKQHKELASQQVPDKELASKVRGLIPRKYSYADAVRQNTPDNQADTNRQPRGRSRSRSRSHNNNSSRGRSQSRPRGGNDFRQPRAPSSNRGDPNPAQRNSTNFGGARPKTNMQRSDNSRPSRSAQPKQYSMPTWELSDTNPEPLDWNETPQMPSVTHPNTNPPDYSKLRGIDNRFFTPDLVKRIAEAYDGLNKY